MKYQLLPIGLLSLTLPHIALSHSQNHNSNQHHNIRANRFDKVLRDAAIIIPQSNPSSSDLVLQERDDQDEGAGEHMNRLSKRAPSYSGRASYFDVGLGACGIRNSNSDFIVAMNEAQYGDMGAVSSWCFQTITISYGGKSHTAEVTDACPGCPYGGLDMSPALFNYFANPDVGIFYMTWTAGSGAAQQDTPTTTTTKTTQQQPTTTQQQWTATTTSTTSAWVAPTTTSVPVASSSIPRSSSSLARSSSSLNRTSLSSTLSSASASSSAPIAGSTAISELPGGNLDQLNQIVIALGGLVGGAAAVAAGSQ